MVIGDEVPRGRLGVAAVAAQENDDEVARSSHVPKPFQLGTDATARGLPVKQRGRGNIAERLAALALKKVGDVIRVADAPVQRRLSIFINANREYIAIGLDLISSRQTDGQEADRADQERLQVGFAIHDAYP